MVNLIVYTNTFVDVTDTQINIPILYTSLQRYKQIIDFCDHEKNTLQIIIFVSSLLIDTYEKLYSLQHSKFLRINQYNENIHGVCYLNENAKGDKLQVKTLSINIFINCRPSSGFSTHGNILLMHNLEEFEKTLCCSNFQRIQLYDDSKSLKDIDYMVQYDPFSKIHEFIDSGSIDTSVLDWAESLAPNTIVTFRFSSKMEPLYYNGVAFRKLTYSDINEFKIFLNAFLGGRKNVLWSIAASEMVILNLFKFLRKETILTKIYFPHSTNIFWFALIPCKNLVNPYLLEKISNGVALNLETEEMVKKNIYSSFERPLFIPNRNDWIHTSITSGHFSTSSFFYRKIKNGYKQYDHLGNYIY